jgi:hypothetical protein
MESCTQKLAEFCKKLKLHSEIWFAKVTHNSAKYFSFLTLVCILYILYIVSLRDKP